MQYIFLILLFAYSFANANIQLIKKENSDSNRTLLVIAGIHGNEPGGYFAASILATQYTIKSKNLWIVPNLNQKSIINNKRGIHGDMNRKFSTLNDKDKDKKTIDEIKKIILSKKVSLVLNLHDGHGFYRKKNQGSIFNPNAWGQTCVIDQCDLKKEREFGDLNNIAINVKNNINKKLLKQHHSFGVKNTNTKYDDEAMQLSLTYFAVTNDKPAFAIETSKNLSSLAQKVFYQLLAIEEYMKIMQISFERNFNLNEKEIAKIIKNYGTLGINNNILLNLNDIKKSLSYIPIKSRSNVFKFSNPLGDIRKRNGKYEVFIGNKRITTLKPQYFKVKSLCLKNYKIIIDDREREVQNASSFQVDTDFKVITDKDYRVNVIGFALKGHKNESGFTISRKDLNKNYSVDNKYLYYRIEFYKKNDFCSMLMVYFK